MGQECRLGKGVRECGLISTIVSFARARADVGVNVRSIVSHVCNQFAHIARWTTCDRTLIKDIFN